MGFFDSSSSETNNYDERFVLDPTDGSIALGQSGDSSTLSSPGSFALGSAGEFNVAGLTIQNFDPAILKEAYAALDKTNSAIDKFIGDLFSAADSASNKSYELAEKSAERAVDAATGQTYDITELAAWAGVLGFAWLVFKGK